MKTWAWRVLPPLLLLPLAFAPLDVVTVLAWVAGFVAALLSVATLLGLLLARLRKRSPDWSRAIRPALTIALFVAVTMVAQRAASREAAAADDIARGAARDVEAACKRDRKCPPSPAGWQLDEQTGRAMTVAGRIQLRYDRSPDGKEFRISVRHQLERGLDIYGGVSKELFEQHVIR